MINYDEMISRIEGIVKDSSKKASPYNKLNVYQDVTKIDFDKFYRDLNKGGLDPKQDVTKIDYNRQIEKKSLTERLKEGLSTKIDQYKTVLKETIMPTAGRYALRLGMAGFVSYLVFFCRNELCKSTS